MPKRENESEEEYKARKKAKKAKKKEKKAEKKEEDSTEQMIEDNGDFEDQDLLAAAADWAELGAVIKQPDSKPTRTHSQTEEKKTTYSMHVTQLSYEASDFDVRDFFVSRGCLVTSVRLVRDKKSGEFQGVAFVDVQDKKSYEIGLKCHRATHLGRRINVRAVLSKEDLGRIAEATKEKVSQIISQANDTKETKENNSKTKVAKKKESPRKRKGSHRKGGNDPNRKLTKKERNRKAAILMAKKKARKS